MTGLVVMGLMSAGIPFIKGVPLLIASRVLYGVGLGLCFPVIMGLSIKQVDREQRASAMGFFQAVYAIGMFAGPVTAGAIGSRWGYTTLFLTTGVVSAVTALVALRLPRRA